MRPPVSFPQLCVVAKEQLLADPSIDYGEWAERIKQRLVHLRLGYPESPHRLTAAMEAVERSLAKDDRPRLTPTPPPPTAPLSVRPLSHEEARRALAQLGALGLLKPMPKARPMSTRIADIHAASRVIAAAIVDSVERCEQLERAAQERPVEPAG